MDKTPTLRDEAIARNTRILKDPSVRFVAWRDNDHAEHVALRTGHPANEVWQWNGRNHLAEDLAQQLGWVKVVELTFADELLPDEPAPAPEGSALPAAENSPASVYDVAEYILSQFPGGISTMKLQKLLYLSQGWNLAITGRPLFDAEFEAWASGPVCREIQELHQGQYTVSAGFIYAKLRERAASASASD